MMTRHHFRMMTKRSLHGASLRGTVDTLQWNGSGQRQRILASSQQGRGNSWRLSAATCSIQYPKHFYPGPSTARGKSLYNAWSVFSGSLEAPQDSLGCSHHSPACKEAHYMPNNMRGYCSQSSFLPGRISLHSFSPRIR